eukprot:357270-Chlamydomonas_euryale.AAC.5
MTWHEYAACAQAAARRQRVSTTASSGRAMQVRADIVRLILACVLSGRCSNCTTGQCMHAVVHRTMVELFCGLVPASKWQKHNPTAQSLHTAQVGAPFRHTADWPAARRHCRQRKSRDTALHPPEGGHLPHHSVEKQRHAI